MQETNVFKLKKPELTDFINVEDLNNNMDEIEAQLLKIPNKNLLHNWDFRNPVNQRGQSSYSSSGYTIDRWRLSGFQTLSVENGHIQLITTHNGFALEHYVENGHLLAGKTITLSAEAKGSYRISAFRFRSGSFTSICNLAGNNADFSFVSVSGTVMTDFISTDLLVLMIRCNDTGSNAQFKRVKLELGSISTLANDPPADYGEQLALCQRYALSIPATNYYRAAYYTANNIAFIIPTPTALRINPSASANPTVMTTALVTQTGFTFTYALYNDCIRVVATKTAHGLTDGTLSVPTMILSADL